MKILQVITSLQIGGAEKLITDMVPRYKERGYEVDVLLFNGQNTPFRERLSSKGIKIFELTKNGNVYNPINIIRLFPYLRHYDIIHTHNTAPQLFCAICSLFCSNKLVTTEHSSSNRRRKLKLYSFIDKWMYKRYNSIICISEAAQQSLTSYLGSSQNITTIYNGVDINQLYSAIPNLSLKNNKTIITMVAGFRYEKDQDTLIRAFSLLPNKNDFELWLIGDGIRRPILEKLTNELKLKNNVRFWGIRSDVPILLKSSDIIVMSSHFEGLSLSNIEGMSVGKPFIASDVNGLREVTNGAGLLFPHGNANILAELLIKLSSDKSYANQIGKLCLEKAKKYDIDETIKQYLNIYDKIMTLK